MTKKKMSNKDIDVELKNHFPRSVGVSPPICDCGYSYPCPIYLFGTEVKKLRKKLKKQKAREQFPKIDLTKEKEKLPKDLFGRSLVQLSNVPMKDLMEEIVLRIEKFPDRSFNTTTLMYECRRWNELPDILTMNGRLFSG